MPSTVKANNMKTNTDMKLQTGILITGIKLKYLSKKQNAYGENHMFQVLDEKQMNDIFKLAEENMKIPVWKYEDKCYLKINEKKVLQYSIDKYNETPDNGIEQIEFKKDTPYIIDLTFYRYEFEKDKETIKGYTISEINKIY